MNTTSVDSASARQPIDATVGSTSASSASAEKTSLMPEPSHCDVSLAMAQMVIQNAFNSRKAAREDRQQATENMIAAQKTQVAELRKEADEKFAAATLKSVGEIAQGTFTVVSAVVPKNDPKGAEAVKGSGQLIAGGCNLGAAFFQHDADLSSARSKTADMEATRQKEAIDGAKDEMDEARQHIRTALDFLREFKATEDKSMSAAIRA